MNEALRRQYLDAMGIKLWRLRAFDAATLAEKAPMVAGRSPTTPIANSAAEPAPQATANPPAQRPNTLGPGDNHVPDDGMHRQNGQHQPSSLPRNGPAASAQPNDMGLIAGSSIAPGAGKKTTSTPAPSATVLPLVQEEPPPWSDADMQGMPMDEPFAPSDAAQFGAPTAPSTNPPANPVDSMDWPALEQTVAGCRACGLCETRTNTVFGVGDRNAELMFVGEGPGQDEDLKGEPFVGRAGQLLNRMLTAAGLKREQVYIANVVKCRPPKNRNPNPEETTACRAYLMRQVALVQPKLVVSLGGVSANNLLDTTESVGRLRGRAHVFGPDRTPLLVTYHPSYYLRTPADKAKGWQDLQRMMRIVREAQQA